MTAGSSRWPGPTPRTTGSSPTGPTSTRPRPSAWPVPRPWPWPAPPSARWTTSTSTRASPSAVEIAAAELGLPDDDPTRPLTVTGGMTFAGGPGNNYGTHSWPPWSGSCGAPRAPPGSPPASGWYVSKHSIGIYGTEPPDGRPPTRPAPRRARWSSRRPGSPGPTPRPPSARSPSAPPTPTPGRGHRRDVLGVVRPRRRPRAGRRGVPDPRGRRAWAQVTDPDHLAVLVTEEGCGRLGTLRPDGEVDLR